MPALRTRDTHSRGESGPSAFTVLLSDEKFDDDKST